MERETERARTKKEGNYEGMEKRKDVGKRLCVSELPRESRAFWGDEEMKYHWEDVEGVGG